MLFPTWYRIYLVDLEEALQSIAESEDIMLPYCNETCDELRIIFRMTILTQVKAFFCLEDFEEERLADAHHEIEIEGRGGILTNN